jgi:hypothetical protein
MHSPKFPLKAKNLRDVINVARLKSTWKNKVREAMRSQPIPDPIENLDFHTRIDAIAQAIESEVLSAAYIPNTPARFLLEKSKGLCRQIVIPSVKDALILQTLSDALWAEIKTKAPTKKSFYAPNDHQFSKTVKGYSSEYGSINAWLTFQRTIFGFAKSKKFIVVTDIANYYDSISYDHLRNILADHSLAKEQALDLLIYTLSCMLWQPDYMPRVPVGLPQSNLDAPRLLAHAFLFEIDEFLDSNKSIDFARYMDDIDIGVDSLSEARGVLRDLDLSLQTRQIRLNGGKTRILNEREAQKHFKVRENHFLDKLAELIDTKRMAGHPTNKERLKVEFAIRAGFRRVTFATGNGEKILKRLVNFARQLHAEIGDDIFYDLISNWPSLRQATLVWWQNRVAPEAKLHLVSKLFLDGGLVDDGAKMDAAISLVAARLPKNKIVADEITKIIQSLDTSQPWDFYVAIWILSKYGSVEDLMKLIETKVSVWVTQEPLSRLVAGVFPRFIGTAHEAKFIAIVDRAGNAWSLPVLEFHKRLAAGTIGYTSVKRFIEARNPSWPNGITHSKFLMVLSLLTNRGIAPTAAGYLKAVHTHALSDEHYIELAL